MVPDADSDEQLLGTEAVLLGLLLDVRGFKELLGVDAVLLGGSGGESFTHEATDSTGDDLPHKSKGHFPLSRLRLGVALHRALLVS